MHAHTQTTAGFLNLKSLVRWLSKFRLIHRTRAFATVRVWKPCCCHMLIMHGENLLLPNHRVTAGVRAVDDLESDCAGSPIMMIPSLRGSARIQREQPSKLSTAFCCGALKSIYYESEKLQALLCGGKLSSFWQCHGTQKKNPDSERGT